MVAAAPHQGGATWAVLQYLLGFKRLGHDVYFVELPENLWTDTQKDHVDCKPFCFAMELGADWIRMELLIRSRQTLHCDCIAYATREQLNFILEFSEELLRACDVRT